MEETRDRLGSELLALSSQTHEIEHALKESEAARSLLEEQLAEAKHLGKVEQKQRKLLEESVAASTQLKGKENEETNTSLDIAIHRKISPLLLYKYSFLEIFINMNLFKFTKIGIKL